jgi:dihydrolipoamide dehydrogenase
MRDLIIVGGGPGGYVAAERAGAKGLSTLLIEKGELGGTCLNRGCIPTKSLLNSAKLYLHARESGRYGVRAQGVEFDLGAAMSWKNEVVGRLRDGVAASMRGAKVEVVRGQAEILGPRKVRLRGTQTVLEAGNIILATGSSPFMPPIPGAAGNPKVVDSTGLLDIKVLPKSLAIIGGGVIGVEFASLFSSLGAKVTVIEMLDEIIPFMDRGQAPLLRRGLKGVSFKLGCRVEGIDSGRVSWTKDGKAESAEADLILMAAGRRPNATDLSAPGSGLDSGPGGVKVDERMRTNLPGVYAIGDVTGKSLLAHSASRMGEVAVDAILGGSQAMRYDAIPWAVYSLPEAAGAGLTESQAEARGIDVKTSAVSLRRSGRFVAENGLSAPGECKLVVNAANDRVLGVHMVGAYASEIIWGAAAAIEMEMRPSDLREIVFPHPSVGETIRDAAWGLD